MDESGDTEITEDNLRVIGGIPIENIWFLMFYASDFFRHKGKSRVDLDEVPDDIPDLVAKILINRVERRLQTALSIKYVERREVVSRVRGRIDFMKTERRQLFARAKVFCNYHDLTVDTPRNRYIRDALKILSRLVKDPVKEKKLKSLYRRFLDFGVTGDAPPMKEIKQERLARFDLEDKGVLDAAHLVHDLQLLTEKSGNNTLFRPETALPYIRELFQRALQGFFQHALMFTGWELERDPVYRWDVETPDGETATDINELTCELALHHSARGESYLIDAKFQTLLTDLDMISQTELYPLFTLLSTQKATGRILKKNRGLLLRPAIGRELAETIVTRGCEIRMCAIDFTLTPKSLREQLLSQVIFR